jgi:hypothetical protein
MPFIESMKRGVPGLGAHLFGNAKVKIRIGVSPNEQKGYLGSPELDQAGCIRVDLVGELGCHLGEGRRGARLLPEVVVDDRPEEFEVAAFLPLVQALANSVRWKSSSQASCCGLATKWALSALSSLSEKSEIGSGTLSPGAAP